MGHKRRGHQRRGKYDGLELLKDEGFQRGKADIQRKGPTGGCVSNSPFTLAHNSHHLLTSSCPFSFNKSHPTLLNFNNTLHMARTKVCLCLSSSSSPTSLNAINSSSSLHSKPPASPPEVRSFPSLTLTHLTFHHLISSSPYPSTGKAPRKQLATKAARKTATAVRAPPPPR